MAALVAGVQYGLSSHSNFYENKSLIFVKLTDSAQRAIEDYLRNRNKINQNPTIQFLGNEGQLSFPSLKSNHGNFTFSLSSNQDIEGPQGGFECIQQIGPKNLESLGTLPCKMRIQANDDVYETTRYRMHVAEENNKNKCTRVIKASEPTGRKIKVRGTLRTIPPPGYINSSASLRTSDFSIIPSSTNSSSKLPSPYKSTNNVITNRSDIQKKSNEIMRRPLKERLIHLLALRPFKRPELYDRINREGVREKEKNIIATVLKQIAFMRDNTYHLHRCMWNDVQEDWPFYTDQEKTMLKRRKPQNLTPPGSSDGGSSGSGQSPNSTHPGSPPAITAPPLGLGSKRPGYYQGNDGLPTKRQRISHYRKPECNYSINSSDNVKSSNAANIANNWDQRQQQHHQRNFNNQQSRQQRNNYIVTKSDLISTSDGEEINSGDLVVLSKPNITSDPLSNNTISYNLHSNLDHTNNHYYQQHQNQEQAQQNINIRKRNDNDEENDRSCNKVVEFHGTIVENDLSPTQVSANRRIRDDKTFRDRDKERHKSAGLSYSIEKSSNVKTDTSEESTIRESYLSFSASSCNRVSPAPSENFRNSEFSDYLTCYTTISSSEQRTRYKAEFNAYYKEYRKLHVQVVKISKQFSQLEEELKEKLDNGNAEGYEAIKHKILQEYARTKNVNARFYYLHDKLGHIKKLVSEYDAQAHIGLTILNNNSQMISTSDFNDNTHHRDVRQNRFALTQIPTETLRCSTKMPHIS